MSSDTVDSWWTVAGRVSVKRAVRVGWAGTAHAGPSASLIHGRDRCQYYSHTVISVPWSVELLTRPQDDMHTLWTVHAVDEIYMCGEGLWRIEERDSIRGPENSHTPDWMHV